MKVKKECSAGVCEVAKVYDNTSTPKVITISMETGEVSNKNVEENIKNINCNNNNNNNNKNEEQKAEAIKHKKNNLNQESSTRLLQIIKSENGVCGFNLTRTKWDPYPWVSVVDADTPAEISGLKVGDCVLEVNGEDVLGLRITDIAKLVKAKSEHVTLLLWSAGCESKFDPESLCDGPMPLTLQRLSIIVQSILSIIECPVCLDTIPPPAMQCQNGHLLCVNCRIRAEKCPVCRDRYTPRRALIAEQIYAAITNAFNLCRTEDKLRQKLFGTNVKHIGQLQQQQQRQQQRPEQCQQQKSIVNMVTTSMDKEEYPAAIDNTMKGLYSTPGAEVCKSASKAPGNGKERVGLQLPANKFLTKLLFSKACSMDNLSSATTTETTVQIQTTNSDDGLQQSHSTRATSTATPSTLVVNNSRTNLPLPVMSATSDMARSTTVTSNNDVTTQRIQSCSNQSHNITNTSVTPKVGECGMFVPEIAMENADYLDDLASTNLGKNKITKVNGMSKHFSLSTNDLLVQQQQLQQQQHSHQNANINNHLSHLNTAALDSFIIATKVKPQCTLNPEDIPRVTPPEEQTIDSPNCSSLTPDKCPHRKSNSIRANNGNSSRS